MLLTLISIAAVVWLFGKLYRVFILASPLDSIPGPPSGSLLQGMSFYTTSLRLPLIYTTTGNMAELYRPDPWKLLDQLTNDYGQVVRLTSILHVSPKVSPSILYYIDYRLIEESTVRI